MEATTDLAWETQPPLGNKSLILKRWTQNGSFGMLCSEWDWALRFKFIKSKNPTWDNSSRLEDVHRGSDLNISHKTFLLTSAEKACRKITWLSKLPAKGLMGSCDKSSPYRSCSRCGSCLHMLYTSKIRTMQYYWYKNIDRITLK